MVVLSVGQLNEKSLLFYTIMYQRLEMIYDKSDHPLFIQSNVKVRKFITKFPENNYKINPTIITIF